MQIRLLRPEVELRDDAGNLATLQPLMQAAIAVLVLAGGQPVRSTTACR